MKIAVLSVTQGEGHGAESVLVELMHGWLAAENSETMMVVAPGHTRVLRVAKELGIPHAGFDADRDALRANTRGLKQIQDAFQDADILHAWTARAFEFGSMFHQRSTAMSGTLHDHPKAFFHGGVRRWIMRHHANRMQGLVCVSEAVRTACEGSGYHCPMEVIPNGLVDLPFAKTDASTVRIGFLGMKARFKGFEIVRSWMETLLPSGVVWELFGEADEELIALLKDLPEASYVLHGRKNPEDIYPLCDIIVHASVEFDSLPTVLIEAARAGLPAITSSLGGGPEIVRHGETGYVFAPDQPEAGCQHLMNLVEDAALRRRMGMAGREHFESSFRVNTMVDRYAAFWRSLKA